MSGDASLQLAIELLSIDSVTPDDKGCQQLICQRLCDRGI